MDPRTKRKQAELVRRHFSSRLERYRFARTKPTFWTRADDIAAQFVHLHLFTSSAEFRVHLGIRVLDDTFPAASLNGPSSYDGWALAKRKYVFRFSGTQSSPVLCADELAAFVTDVGLPWFDRFASSDALLGTDSPLSDEERTRLRSALSGRRDAAAIAASRKVLGLST